MEKDEFDHNQVNPDPTLSASSNMQPIGSQSIVTNEQNGAFMPTITSLSESSRQPVNGLNKSKKIAIILISLILILVGVILVLFFIGTVGEHRIEVGDYTVVIDENKWHSSIGQDGNTLVVMSEESPDSAIGLLPYGKEITYDLLDQKDSMKTIISQMENVQFGGQSTQVISNTRCIVVNIRYEKAVYANNEAIKAFCESKDGTIFLIEVEGANRTELNSNLAVGVDIINTAKLK